MVVTAISAAFGHARTASISKPMPCAGFPWVYASLATWCTAPISRTILAVEALRLVKKDPPGARASRPHKPRHDGREPRKGGFGAPCKGVALDGRLFAGIRMRAGRPRSQVVFVRAGRPRSRGMAFRRCGGGRTPSRQPTSPPWLSAFTPPSPIAESLGSCC